MDKLIEQHARQVGMKPTEVLEVVPVDDGHAVRTHDGQWTLVRDDGVLVHAYPAPESPTSGEADAGEATEAMLRGFRGEADPVDKPATRPATPKRRGRA